MLSSLREKRATKPVNIGLNALFPIGSGSSETLRFPSIFEELNGVILAERPLNTSEVSCVTDLPAQPDFLQHQGMELTALVLTPHPGPLPVEGRGRRDGSARRGGTPWPRGATLDVIGVGAAKQRGEPGDKAPAIHARVMRPLAPRRGEGRGER